MTIQHRGTSRDYLLARVAEKDPALAARVRRGEISAFAAAQTLGLTPPRISIAGHNPVTIAASLRRYLPSDVRRAVADLLAAEPQETP